MERREEILGMRKARMTWRAIGDRMGISRERARQIAKGPPPPHKPALGDKVMLNVTDVSDLLGIHVNTVRRWAQKGLLPAYRLGARGDRRFRREDIDNFLGGKRA
ncbi:hypothetical protein ES703_100049 [subsurface metagenome]